MGPHAAAHQGAAEHDVSGPIHGRPSTATHSQPPTHQASPGPWPTGTTPSPGCSPHPGGVGALFADGAARLPGCGPGRSRRSRRPRSRSASGSRAA
ncbi:H-X9-DG-CTERM domain-containing protein [Streptomyces sp. NPDC093509]|uniref:H-X9-DG-CTERM domain-containing protein n=1 Tax=Streptomyces sp. NPDC093509 TaxID=3154982 RepID=UPI00344EAE81